MFRPLLLIISGLLAIVATGPAMAQAAPSPQLYLQAFNDTCRRGFPDLDAIAAHAQTIGWVSSAPRLVGGSQMPDLRVFYKGGVMLFLLLPTDGISSAVCQIGGGSDGTKATSTEIAAIVSPSLNAGDPVFEKDDGKDIAVWQVAPGISVEAGIGIYRRKVRSIRLLVRQVR